MGNAIKFTYTGHIGVKLSFDDGWLSCDVEDTGLGIKQNDLDKLFRFFGCLTKTRDINRGGMGLGLTISKMIIQQLNGEIECESIEGKGSVFRFKIPLSELHNNEANEIRRSSQLRTS